MSLWKLITIDKNLSTQKLYTLLRDNPTLLAPMAGVTDVIFREICKTMGCGLTCTEMLSAKGLKFAADSRKAQEILAVSDAENLFAIQLFGSDSEIMGEQTRRLCERYNGRLACIDINMGCPAPKITNNGEGSALMKTPELAAKVIQSTVKHATVPVTVKFRKGWGEHDNNAVDFAIMAQECGAAAVTVHGRTRMQYYAGRADWQVIAQVKDALKIPVIGNGDIFSAQDALHMQEQTNCDAVMVARGALGNPWLFAQINALRMHQEIQPVTVRQKIEMAILHAERVVAKKGVQSIVEIRKHIAWYIRDIRNSAHIRNLINSCVTLEALKEILNSYILALEAD